MFVLSVHSYLIRSGNDWNSQKKFYSLKQIINISFPWRRASWKIIPSQANLHDLTYVSRSIKFRPPYFRSFTAVAVKELIEPLIAIVPLIQMIAKACYFFRQNIFVSRGLIRYETKRDTPRKKLNSTPKWDQPERGSSLFVPQEVYFFALSTLNCAESTPPLRISFFRPVMELNQPIEM